MEVAGAAVVAGTGALIAAPVLGAKERSGHRAFGFRGCQANQVHVVFCFFGGFRGFGA